MLDWQVPCFTGHGLLRNERVGRWSVIVLVFVAYTRGTGWTVRDAARVMKMDDLNE